MWVKIKNSVVKEVIPDYATPPSEWYPTSFANQCVETTDETVCVGMWYDADTGTFSSENPNPEEEEETTSDDSDFVTWAELSAAIAEGVNSI